MKIKKKYINKKLIYILKYITEEFAKGFYKKII